MIRRAWLPLLLLGCESGTSIGQLRPMMVLDPAPGTPLAFDPVVLGLNQAEPRIIAVKNEGPAPLHLGWRTEGPARVRVSSFPERLDPGAAGEIWVRFEPTRPVAAEPTRLWLQSDDPERSEVSYPLELAARDPCRIEPWPEVLRFRVGEEAELGLLASGTAPCEIQALGVDEALFALVDPPPLPLSLEPGEEVPIRLQHRLRTHRDGVPVRELRVRDQDGQEVRVKLEGAYPLFNCVDVQPPVIEFPDTALGEVEERLVVITNRCVEPVPVRNVAVFLSHHAFSVVEQAWPQLIPPLGAIVLPIQYRPSDELADIGTVVITTDDSERPRFETYARGRALYPGIRFLPSLDLGPVGFSGTVPSGCGSRVARFPIWSTGRGRLLVDGVQLGGPDAPAFEYLGVELDGQRLAGPGEAFSVPVGVKAELLFRFRPLREEPARHQAQLELHHYDFRGQREAELVGWAAPLSPRAESQVVGPTPVDLLVTVDDSRSMQAEQERLVFAAGNFVRAADTFGADYQLAVARGENSSPDAGQLRACPLEDPIVRSSEGTTDERAARFACLMRTGRRGAEDVSGLGAAAAALDRALFPTPRNPSTAVNARFLRPEARLVVLTASDEDDGSREEVPALLDYLRGTRGFRADRVQIHALAGAPGQRCAADPYLNPGGRYQAMTDLAGGAFYEICAEDYGPYFSDLAARAFAPSGVFILSGSVDPPSLRVELDGAILSLGTDYGYDPIARAVSLGTPPALGQVMTASYRGECLP